MIGLLAGVAIGATATAAFNKVQQIRREREIEGQVAEKFAGIMPPSLRPALPNAVIPIPQDEEDFEVLQAAVEDCHRVLAKRPTPTTQAALRDCILGAIYPDFPWPPVPGDAPSAGIMWMIANHEAGKALAEGKDD